ncbi:MAG: hypothetical protein P4L42_02490 [Desulfocapsaceae bacterium]|nr:hypothetical protein [Desulfocapsaceae bacterium]
MSTTIMDAVQVPMVVLEQILAEPADAVERLDQLVVSGQAPKHIVLRLLSEHFGIAPIEYDEMILLAAKTVLRLDLGHLLAAGWFPIAETPAGACIATSVPGDPRVAEAAREVLHARSLHFRVALPSDIRRFIENHRDVNPGFPASAGRTALARLRTWMAEQRTLLAGYRTSLAKGRTGLAFIRTGLAFISIALVLLRIFGIGILNVPELVLLGIGAAMTVDGLRWYLPIRKIVFPDVTAEATFETLAVDGLKRTPLTVDTDKGRFDYASSESTFGTTILEFDPASGGQAFRRTPPVDGAEDLRMHWNRLTPVMRRRFLAIDRTDLAEERTVLAHYRTVMARARTGLAFTRTGIAFSGLGIALLRQFPASAWTVFDLILIMMGIAMTLEGIHWYLPGRRTTRKSAEAVRKTFSKMSIWDFIFRPFHKCLHPDDLPPTLTIKGSYAPGIWGTTGLALERTLIAERRNVKSRLRTVMARSRTGMSFIRTGTSFFSVGLGLQVYFGSAILLWTLHNAALMILGLFLIADGFFWHLPAEKTKKEFPYCFADMEIMFPDYAKPLSFWKKVIFSHEGH